MVSDIVDAQKQSNYILKLHALEFNWCRIEFARETRLVLAKFISIRWHSRRDKYGTSRTTFYIGRLNISLGSKGSYQYYHLP